MRFVIHAPPRVGSAGVRALYLLGDMLRDRGHAVGHADQVSPAAEHQRDSIHIYSESITGNPSGAEKVVRWCLNVPGLLTGQPMGEGPNDLIMAWDPHCHPGPRLRIPTIETEWFYPKTTPGTGTALWVYKGAREVPMLPEPVCEITVDWPTSREALADVLRSVDLVYSCDPFSALNDEAVICGTPVLFSPLALAVRPRTVDRHGTADSWSDLGIARFQVTDCAERYQQLSAEIAWDVDDFVTRCAERWGRQ